MTKEEPQLRQITREDIEFLAALQNEMNTQPHVGQADPRFWVVMTHRLRMTLRDEDIDYVAITSEDGELIEELTLSEAVRRAKEAGISDNGWLTEMEVIKRYYESIGASVFPEIKEERIAENTMFLTLREAQEHIKRNDYHYIDARPFAMTAWRSPQVAQLYKILHEVDFQQLLEVAEDGEQGSRVLRLLEPQGEPDIIGCDGRLYVPDEECEFVPEEFDTVWDEEDQCLRIAKPSDDCDCFTCSKCGQELTFDWGGEYSWFEPEYPYKPISLKYCPGCRARVLFPHPWLDSKEEE